MRLVHNGRKLTIGLLKLTDAAPVIMAKELGLFARENVDVALSIEPSWATLADKLAYGFVDAGVMLAPLVLATNIGLRGAPRPLIVPMNLSLGGNTVTLSPRWAERRGARNRHWRWFMRFRPIIFCCAIGSRRAASIPTATCPSP